MDFEWSAEQAALRASVEEFARRELAGPFHLLEEARVRRGGRTRG